MALTGKDVGACLRDARERKGLSLRQIAAATRISVSALDAIERNDIRRLPGGIFSRAFVRGYAHEVGLDPEETVRDFVEQFPVEAVPTAARWSKRHPPTATARWMRIFKPWPNLLVIGAALAVGVVGLTLAVLWARGALTASASTDSPAPATPAPVAPARAAPSTSVPRGLQREPAPIISSGPCARGCGRGPAHDGELGRALLGAHRRRRRRPLRGAAREGRDGNA